MPRGDKPTTVALALKDGWVYEDTLPATITTEEYDWWFRESLVLDGVRMGPPLTTRPPDHVWVKLLSNGELSAYRTDIRKEHHDGRPVFEYTPLSPASAAPVVDEKALKKRARQVIDAVIESPVIVEVRTFSQPEELDKLENRVAALLQKSIPAAAAAAPQQSDELVDEVQHRMDQVVEAAVEWHQAGREGGEWFEAAEKLGAAIDSLLELRGDPQTQI